ncbi:hypothetical protein PO909_013417 [Leuciscus waleckii]
MSHCSDTAGGGQRTVGRRLDHQGTGHTPKVFSVDQERKLEAYIKNVCRFAYELASRYGCKYPSGWNATKMAGKDWLTSFLERNKTLSIRRPQATSMSCSTSFNKTNVSSFFKNLQTVLLHKRFEAKDIWNVVYKFTIH